MRIDYLVPTNPDDLKEYKEELGPLHLLDPRLGTQAYPNLLISYPAWRNKPTGPMRSGRYVLSDSGGYNLLDQNPPKLCPRQVVRWQIKNSAEGVGLDLPPFPDTETHRDIGWDEGLRQTVRNVRAARSIYVDAKARGSSFGWLAPIQGRTREQMDEWAGRLGEVHEFDSFAALKPHPRGCPIATATCLGFAREMKRVHILGSGGQRVVKTLAALAPLTNIEHLSLDCSSPANAGRNRRFLGIRQEGLGWTWEDETEPLSYRCDCVACELTRDEERRGVCSGLVNAADPHRRIMHNTLLSVRVWENLRAAAAGMDPARFLTQVLDRDARKRVPEILRAFEG